MCVFLKAHFIFYGDEHDDKKDDVCTQTHILIGIRMGRSSTREEKKKLLCVCIIFDDQFTLIVLLWGKMDKSDIITVYAAWVHISLKRTISHKMLIKNTC